MKILIADKFPAEYLKEIVNLNYEYTLCPDITSNELVNKIIGFDILIVRSKKIDSTIIKSSDKLKMIIRAGSGYDTIDIESAKDKNIIVSNVPGKNSIAVAELTMGLILSIDRRIPDNVLDLRKSYWDKGKYSNAVGIFGRTLGVIGAGKIGLKVIERAISFGLKILVFDPNYNSNIILNEMMIKYNISVTNDIYDIARFSDIITLHIPLNENTQGIINKKFLNYVKKDGVIINTSRGELIIEEDLLIAINEKNIKVGIDVYSNEPKAKCEIFNSKIAKHTNVYGTHHIGASTFQAQNSVAEGVIEILESFKIDKIINQVN